MQNQHSKFDYLELAGKFDYVELVENNYTNYVILLKQM